MAEKEKRGVLSADLCFSDVLYSEVEPDSKARVAGVRTNKEVKLKLTDVVHTSQVSCRSTYRLNYYKQV